MTTPYEPLPPAVAAVAEEEMARLGVPGVAVGVVHAGRSYAGGFGVTNVDHSLPVTPETLFQIGSTSKTFTAMAAMQLVEEGAIEIEARVRRYLPDFRLESEADAARLTVRHLLSHHGGWQGDYFRDTGRGDDAIARIVAKMARSPQIVPAGTAFSYNNAGYYVLGRIVEVLRGAPFEMVIGERILAPLGMAHSCYFPEEALTHRVAAGHAEGEDGRQQVFTPWAVSRSIAPGGGQISDVVDQLRYAAFHLGDGSAPDGTRLLATATLQRMQQPLAAAGSMCDEIGASWMLSGPPGRRKVAHGGATNGHLSAFELFPEHGYGCTVLTNSFNGRGLRQSLTEACQRAFLGFASEEPPVFGGDAGETDLAGVYKARLHDLTVTVEGGVATLTQVDAQRGRAPSEERFRLRAIAPRRWWVTEGSRRGETCELVEVAGARLLRWDGRLAPRVG
jgi:CubicO group peptidase (beta-lactamase class C family)